MRVTCEVCESAPAVVMCVADQACMCASCDEKVHAANKVVGKHERVPIDQAAPAPVCDICQEENAYFFCKDDRALLCRGCDLSIHSANAAAQAHERFLLTGARAGLAGKCCGGEGHGHAHAHASAPAPVAAPAPAPAPVTAAKPPRAPAAKPARISEDDTDATVPGLNDEAFVAEFLDLPGINGGFGMKDVDLDGPNDGAWSDICKMLDSEPSENKRKADGPYRKIGYMSMDAFDLGDGDVPDMGAQAKRMRMAC